MEASEYMSKDGIALAEMVRNGEVTPLELVETAVSIAEKYNPQLNAIVTEMYEEARKNATIELPTSLLSGVPFLLKDLGSNFH